MALTGNTVASTYLDLVQLEQSGAGLPSHAGKEAALYDGSGAQIVGRTAQRHWLDPHPDAASFDETWEFSTTGDMTQGELETAGWTFSNCTGEIANGIFWLRATGTTAVAKATLTVSLAGDFDICAAPLSGMAYGDEPHHINQLGSIYVGDVAGDDAHGVSSNAANGRIRLLTKINGTLSGLAGTSANKETYLTIPLMRISRVSGTVYCSCGNAGVSYFKEDDTATDNNGWMYTSVADAATFDSLVLALGEDLRASTTKEVVGFYFLRRFQ